MNELFDVFFHQKAIPDGTGTVLFEVKRQEDFIDLCEDLYNKQLGGYLTIFDQAKHLKRISQHPSLEKYLEIQFYQVELNWDVLLDELKEIFPQFIWTKVVEEVSGAFSTYSCEFIPVEFKEDAFPFRFNLSESMRQMGYSDGETVSEVLETRLLALLQDEDEEKNQGFEIQEEVFFPVKVTLADSEEATETFDDELHDMEEPEADDVNDDGHEYEEDSEELIPVVEAEIRKPSKKVRTASKKSTSSAPIVRSDENEIVYLQESIKREKASKDRLRVAKEKLEHELLAIENSLLVSGLKRFKTHKKSEVEEEDWYKPVRIDLIKYDDLYKKAKFIEQSWRLNRELVTITEKMVVTKDELVYERARVEKVKNSVSELDLQTMMEQCHLIDGRVKIRRGFFFLKPSVKLYQIDYEQLEKISAFFDIIQTENRLLERMIEQTHL